MPSNDYVGNEIITHGRLDSTYRQSLIRPLTDSELSLYRHDILRENLYCAGLLWQPDRQYSEDFKCAIL